MTPLEAAELLAQGQLVALPTETVYGLAARADDDTAVAHGHFVHVFVDRATRTAVAIPPTLRAALERLLVT